MGPEASLHVCGRDSGRAVLSLALAAAGRMVVRGDLLVLARSRHPHSYYDHDVRDAEFLAWRRACRRLRRTQFAYVLALLFWLDGRQSDDCPDVRRAVPRLRHDRDQERTIQPRRLCGLWSDRV